MDYFLEPALRHVYGERFVNIAKNLRRSQEARRDHFLRRRRRLFLGSRRKNIRRRHRSPKNYIL